jgi:hypothetical protein
LLGLDPEGPINREQLIKAACNNWLGVNRTLKQLETQRPQDLISLTYEALLADTQGEYARVCKALGLSCDPHILQQAVEACSFSKASGRQQGDRDLSSFFTSGTSGGWRNELSPDEADLAATMCSPLLEEAGYTP